MHTYYFHVHLLFSPHKFLDKIQLDIGHLKTNMTAPLSLKSPAKKGEYKTLGEGVMTFVQIQEIITMLSQMPNTAQCGKERVAEYRCPGRDRREKSTFNDVFGGKGS